MVLGFSSTIKSASASSLHCVLLGSLALGLVQLVAAPSALALSFTTGSSSTSPFFFNGYSSTSSWTLYSDSTVVPAGTWGNLDSVPCVPENGLCVVLNSSDSVTIHGGGGALEQTKWESLNGGVGGANGYMVSFTGTFTPGPDSASDATATYSYGTFTSQPLGATFTVDPFFLATNQKVTFRISNGLSSYGDLRINNFNSYAVPGPLPAAGAASAFGFSRRLRRRVKNDAKSAAPRRLIPSDPSAYLNLSTPALNHLPASFCYASAPRFISPSSIPAMNSTYRPSPADQGSVDDNDVESSRISSTQS